MAIYAKCTFFYSQLNQGWQEIYYINSATIQATVPFVVNLGNALLAFPRSEHGDRGLSDFPGQFASGFPPAASGSQLQRFPDLAGRNLRQ